MNKFDAVIPQFTRPDNWTKPAYPQLNSEGWESLKDMSKESLKDLGFSVWENHGKTVMLFPAEWYPHIPIGFPITDINLKSEFFGPKTDNDMRCGFLPYGILLKE